MMKFFLTEDYNSLGDDLSENQTNYFKNSKIRDSKGNLFVAYHGDLRGNIEVFNCANHPKFFSLANDYAGGYGEHMYNVYLNITNPFSLADEDQYWFIIKNFYGWLRKNNIPPIKMSFDIGKAVPLQLVDPHDSKYYFYEFLKETKKYDGIIVNEGYSKPRLINGVDSNLSYVPLYANQIKSISNLDPTKSDNIYK